VARFRSSARHPNRRPARRRKEPCSRCGLITACRRNSAANQGFAGRDRIRYFPRRMRSVAVSAIWPRWFAISHHVTYSRLLAVQMILGCAEPKFPTWIANWSVTKRHLRPVLVRAIPLLEWIEKIVHPRLEAPANRNRKRACHEMG
jgi:hypothetical protein